MTAHDILTQEIVQSVKTMCFGNEDIKFLLHIVYVLFVLSHIVLSLSSSSSSTNCSSILELIKEKHKQLLQHTIMKGIMNKNKTAFKAAIRLHLGCFPLIIFLLQRSAYTSSLGSNSNLLWYLTKSFIHAGSRTARWLRRFSNDLLGSTAT